MRKVIRFAGLLVLLAEYLVLSFRFDLQNLSIAPGPWAWLRHAGALGPFVLLFPALLLIVHDDRFRSGCRRLLVEKPSKTVRAVAWIIHGLTVVLVLGVAEAYFPTNSGAIKPVPSSALSFLWIGSAIAAVIAILVATFPLRALGELIVRERVILGWTSLLGAIAVVAGTSGASLWEPLADVTLDLCSRIIGLLAEDLVLVPEERLLGTEQFFVEIAPECSGIEGVALITVFMGAYLLRFRAELRFPAVLVLIPAAVIIVWCANIVRISSLILLGAWISPELAVGGFHSKAGWLFFCLISLGMVAISRRFALFASSPRTSAEESRGMHNPVAPFLMPLLALTAVGMMTGLFADAVDRWYVLRILAALVVLMLYRDALLPHLRGRVSWESVAIGALVFVGWYLLEPSASTSLLPSTATATSTATSASASASASVQFESFLDRLGDEERLFYLFSRVLGSSIIVPLVEEIAFRGYLQRRLIDSNFTEVPFRQFSWRSFLITSLVFGLLHSRWLAGVFAGAAYGLAVYRRGRLLDAVVAHAVTNGLIALVVLGFDDLRLWM